MKLSKQKLIDRLKVIQKHYMTLKNCMATMFYQNELKHAKLNGSKFGKDRDRLNDFYVKELCFTVQRVAFYYQNYHNYEPWISSRGERI